MKTDNTARGKSYAFAVRVVQLYQHLSVKKKEYLLSKQLLRSGTSIGANAKEGIGGNLAPTLSAKWPLPIKKHVRRAIGCVY